MIGTDRGVCHMLGASAAKNDSCAQHAGSTRHGDSVHTLPAILAASDPRAPGLAGLAPDAARPANGGDAAHPVQAPAPADMAMIADTIADLISRGAQRRELTQPMIAPAEARRRAGLVTALLVGGALFALTGRDGVTSDAARPDDVAVIVAALGLAGFHAATAPAALESASRAPRRV